MKEKIKCPKNEGLNDLCNTRTTRDDDSGYTYWFCTGPVGHTGNHHVHDRKGNCYKTWK